MHITAAYSVISVVLGMVISFLFVAVLKMGAMGKVLGMFPTVLIFFFISFFTIKKYSQGLWSWASIKKQLLFGLPLIIAIWSYEILHIADRYILERMTDMKSVGIYTFGYQLAELPMFLVLGIRQLWNPIFYENMNKGDTKTVSRLVLYYILALTFINMAVILFSKELILLFINKRYYLAIPFIGVIVLGVYFNGLLTISNSLLSYKNKFGLISKIALIASLINIFLNILLIPVIGLMGSALATFIAYLIYFILGLIFEKETLRQIGNNFVLFVPILFISISCLLAFVMNSIHPGKLSFLELTLKSLYLLSFFIFIFASGWIGKKQVNYVLNLVKIKLLSSKTKK
jgi:O-antigen/teichoic acid export membrane protein